MSDINEWGFYAIGGGGWARLCPSCTELGIEDNGTPDSTGTPELGTVCDGECGTTAKDGE